MNENQQRLNDINQEPGASSWISSLPLEDEGYVLNKQLFWDLIHIKYGWELTCLPENCVCGVKFGLQHVLSRKKGGFVTIRLNQVRNITATLLNEICNNVQIEHYTATVSQENILTLRLLPNMKTHDWTFQQEDFEVLVKKHYLT